jgi:hypothetical protein
MAINGASICRALFTKIDDFLLVFKAIFHGESLEKMSTERNELQETPVFSSKLVAQPRVMLISKVNDLVNRILV